MHVERGSLSDDQAATLVSVEPAIISKFENDAKIVTSDPKMAQIVFKILYKSKKDLEIIRASFEKQLKG